MKVTVFKNQNVLRDACSLPSAGDSNNIILGVPRSNHKEQDRFKDNIIKQNFGYRRKILLLGDC